VGVKKISVWEGCVLELGGWDVNMGVMLKKYMGAVLTCISGLVYVSGLL
jgi:hypothetical protein